MTAGDTGKSVSADFEITKATLTVSGTTIDDKKYDGKKDATVSTTGTLQDVKPGDKVEINTATGTFKDKNAGTGKEVKVEYTLKGADAGNYSVKDCETSATINKRAVNLESADGNKQYDGSPLTNDNVTVGGDGWVSGEGADYNVTGSQTFVGESFNEFSFTLWDGKTSEKKETKDENYIIQTFYGTLTVTQNTKSITITADSKSKKYDGTALTDDGFTFTKGVIGDADELTATVEGTITESGSVANKVNSYVVMHDGKDVTSYYAQAYLIDGTLTVEKRNVTLTSASASKVHDGTPLTEKTVNEGGEGFASGEGATYTFTGSQTDIGTSKNYFTYELNSNTRKENYNITEVYGTLTVTKLDEFAVIFDAQGHGTAPAPQVVVGGEKVKKPADLSEEGYIFGGWFADKDCKNAWDFDKNTVTQNITLYAKWTEKTAIEDCEIVLSHEAYEFNNKVQIPNVTLTDPNGKILEEDKDYRFELEYSKNVGTYAVVVEGIGAYKGGASASYVINPASKSIKSIKAGKKKLTVKWTKRTGAYKEQTTGYQIKYSTSKSFKNAKNAYAKKAGATSKTIKNVKAKKKYYVKMRTYKTVDGQKYYSSWSKVKTKKTR